MTDVLRSDIGLTRFTGVPSAIRLTEADSWGTLDAGLVPGMRGGVAQDREPKDLARVSGRENLAQALILRLLTPVGSLKGLGHPRYGCRLTELIGMGNTDLSRLRARLYVLQALRQERRVSEVLGLSVVTVDDRPETVRIAFSVRPLGEDEAMALGLEVAL